MLLILYKLKGCKSEHCSVCMNGGDVGVNTVPFVWMEGTSVWVLLSLYELKDVSVNTTHSVWTKGHQCELRSFNMNWRDINMKDWKFYHVLCTLIKNCHGSLCMNSRLSEIHLQSALSFLISLHVNTLAFTVPCPCPGPSFSVALFISKTCFYFSQILLPKFHGQRLCGRFIF